MQELLQELRYIRAQKKSLSIREEQITEQIADNYQDVLAGKVGTQNIDGIKFHIPKSVVWDQEKLQELYDACVDNPREYISVKYSVAESKYNAWPEHIRQSFEPARTVKTGKVTIKTEEEE